MRKYDRNLLVDKLKKHIEDNKLSSIKIAEIAAVLDISPTYARLIALDYVRKEKGWSFNNGVMTKVLLNE